MDGNSRLHVRFDKILIFLNLVFCTLISLSSSCPSPCVCGFQSGSKWIECVGANFTTLPNDIPLDTNLMFLTNTKITSFSANAFSKLSHLVKIELLQNKIENITDGVFNGLSKLKTLNLPNNGIRRISSNAFGGLTTLTKLSLSDNKLTSLPEDMLKDQANLNTLHLNGNNLTRISSDMLRKQTKLAILYLNKNQIQSIEDKAFESAGKTLLMVNLENNRLTSLPRALNGIKSAQLIQIGLGNNLITLIPQEAEPFFERVKNSQGKISLSGNPLVCTSGLQWLQTWIKQNKKHVQDYDEVMCAKVGGNTTKLIDYNFNSTVFPETTAPTTTSTSTTTAPTSTIQITTILPSTHTSPLTTLKPQTTVSTQPITTTTKLLTDWLTSTSRVMSITEALTRATDVITRKSPNVKSTQEMPDEADMTALKRNKYIILATCLSAAFIGLVVFVAMYCFQSKIVKRDKVLTTRYDRVRIV
ncbi:slit homolog 2 protein-like isoform X2 [Actinia tenebrosa]|uniref:Slit homolog 2 protein-like isoform X2 n=1 Tax=Actinia tenebrosa TaxID=6105 RepID=A0A6P8HY64_ACTTE|nr:slit homolog 2 protein-like isoform X2 [Actinia tenebrosa]